MDTSECQQMTCPITGHALPEDKVDVEVVFGVAVPSSKMKTCGHTFTMGALVDVLQEHKGPVQCLACDKSLVISVWDSVAARKLCKDNEPYELIAVRYGQQMYWLTIPECEGKRMNAQDRIAQVLGIGDNLKILHNGKMVFPDADKTPDEVSSHLIDICRSEVGKKPSLIIMGKRTGRWGAQGGHIHR